MKAIYKLRPELRVAGSALLLTMIMVGVGLAILAGALSWSASSTRLTYRSIQYTRSEAAAEAATEMVVSQMSRDFLMGGNQLVNANLSTYQRIVPTATASGYWSTWQFSDANGHFGQTYVQPGAASSYISITPPYTNLQANVITYTVVSDAKDTASLQDLTVGVLQQVQLASIPVFQFSMYSSGEMEISCGQPFTINGPVHANGILYVEPDNALTFESSVSAVITNLFQRDPLDSRGLVPNGTVVYQQLGQPVSPVAALTLPIGVTNTPEGIREIIEPPPPGEDPASPLGHLRYYNQSDLLITVSDTGITGTNGLNDGFPTTVSTNDLAFLVSTNSSFYDAREGKTVQSIDLNISNLMVWSQTNAGVSTSLIGSNLSSVYINDTRNLPGTRLGAVRVVNGAILPPNGLTVATGRPLYVLNDYNSDTANRGTANTSLTAPASLVADAITILSDGWSDANSTAGVGSRNASSTTVNAAFLTGDVETTTAHYSGGMENFPRFLETWGTPVFTYNGSMIKMFPSLYATNAWNNNNNIYTPPTRRWAFDVNFRDPNKLPPKTPSLLKVIRHQWSALPAGLTAPP